MENPFRPESLRSMAGGLAALARETALDPQKRKRIAFAAAVILLFAFFSRGCGPKAGLTGFVLDGKGRPLPGLTVMAAAEKPGKKSPKPAKAETGKDGSFRFPSLSPDSRYVLSIKSDKWTTSLAVHAGTGQADTEIPLPAPLTMRFTRTPDGVIHDSRETLEWLPGPARDLDHRAAARWIRRSRSAGTGWRLPRVKELAGLVAPNPGGRCQIDPIFGLKTCLAWSELLPDERFALVFDFENGKADPKAYNAFQVATLAVRVPR